MNREDIQRKAGEILLNDKRLILQWATSLGKGTMAVKAIDRIRPEKTLLVVAETAHKENWKKEFEKFDVGFLFDSLVIECYASLKNYRDTSWDLIVFDEAHHLGSDIRMDILHSMKAGRVLALSATLSNPFLLYTLESTFGKFKTWEITLQQAIDNNYLPKPEVILLPLTLDNKVVDQIIEEGWGKSAKRVNMECNYADRWNILRHRNTSFPNVNLKIHCTALQKYLYLCDQFNYWQKKYFSTRTEIMKYKWLQWGTQRKRFLGELKTPEVKKLINYLRDTRFICFCTSINQANTLGGELAIHSENKNNAEIIEDFNTKKTDRLYAVGMLQEGQNLKDIEAGVIVQLDGKERAFIQKFGRSLRSENPVQYIFYYKGTRDEEYLKNVLENINPEFIQEMTL